MENFAANQRFPAGGRPSADLTFPTRYVTADFLDPAADLRLNMRLNMYRMGVRIETAFDMCRPRA